MALLKRAERVIPLPYHPSSSSNHDAATLELHPVPQKGLIIKVEPPREPLLPLEHVPCDIVLSIDVSGSMTKDAPVPANPGEEAEHNGLSVLDLVKHAARTIVQTLNENDRLAIVTFASASTVLQELLPMTPENKRTTDERIESMQPKDATNLWHGIRDGLKLFKDDEYNEKPKRIPALMVLTDGCPNHMCPVQGYVPRLRSMGKLPAIINAFGFGYSLRSGLLKSIAEVSGGSYAFIPDAGMVGTVFIHAVANLQSTFAQNAVLRLSYPSNITEPYPQADQAPSVKLPPVKLPSDNSLRNDYRELTINLHNLQYGQPRDIFLEYSSWNSSPIIATLTYQRLNQPPETLSPTILYPSAPAPSPTYSAAEAAFHISRSKLIAFLLNLSPPSTHHEERTPTIPLPDNISSDLASLISTLPCNSSANPEISSHPPNKALLEVLNGQISLAINNADYYARWGVHYLPSLADAHSKQACNSFKDPGPLMYGVDSPLFIKCRDRLNNAFDDLPAPKPSNEHWMTAGGYQRHGGSRPAVRKPRLRSRGTNSASSSESGWGGSSWADFSMRSYNSSDTPCFAGCVRVLLAGPGGGEGQSEEELEGKGKRPLTPTEMTCGYDDDDFGEFPWLDSGNINTTAREGHQTGQMIRIGKLRAGMQVQTPRGPRRVVAVLKTAVNKQEMCLVGRKGLLVTPWHPVSLPTRTATESTTTTTTTPLAQPGSWTFPRDISRRKVSYTGSIYSVLLERDGDHDAHALFVGGVWGVTLGHGLVPNPARGANGSTGESSKADSDVRVHPFFGDYSAVVRSLERLHRNSNGLVLGGGVKRDERTGLVDGFRRLSGEEVRRVVDEMLSSGAGPKSMVQSRSSARGRSTNSNHTGAASRHGSSNSSSRSSSSSTGGGARAGTCMWRQTVGCI